MFSDLKLKGKEDQLITNSAPENVFLHQCLHTSSMSAVKNSDCSCTILRFKSPRLTFRYRSRDFRGAQKATTFGILACQYYKNPYRSSVSPPLVESQAGVGGSISVHSMSYSCFDGMLLLWSMLSYSFCSPSNPELIGGSCVP